jgi:hypothetical protein
MRPALTTALAATVLASAALALWADPPETEDAADAATVAAAARRPVAMVAAASAVAAVAPATTTPAADITAADPGTASPPPGAQLPTRAADWPAPAPAGLAAWQAQVAPADRRVVAAAAAPASAASRPAAVFPYRWIGQLDDGDGAPQQLLASEQSSVGVRPGATLDGRWRLLRNDAGRLLAQALPDGETVPVPGAPAALP